jgi:hypothetical protein
MQLVVGYRGAASIAGEPEVEFKGEAETVLEALFGEQSPYVYQADRF